MTKQCCVEGENQSMIWVGTVPVRPTLVCGPVVAALSLTSEQKETAMTTHVITVEFWSTPVGVYGGSQLGPHRLVDWKSSREKAELQANQLAGTYCHHGFDAEAGYWWGREAEAGEVHRFLVRAATEGHSPDLPICIES
jgi:hypothetical protein